MAFMARLKCKSKYVLELCFFDEHQSLGSALQVALAIGLIRGCDITLLQRTLKTTLSATMAYSISRLRTRVPHTRLDVIRYNVKRSS